MRERGRERNTFLTLSHVEHWPAVPNRSCREGALWEFAQPNRKLNLHQLQAVQHKWVIQQQSDEDDDHVHDHLRLCGKRMGWYPSTSPIWFPRFYANCRSSHLQWYLLFLKDSALCLYCHYGAMMRRRQIFETQQHANGWLILLTCFQVSVCQTAQTLSTTKNESQLGNLMKNFWI